MPPRSARPPDARAVTISLSAPSPRHHGLLAFQRVAALAVGPRRGRHIGEVVARLPFLVGERQGELALGDGRHQLLQ